MFDPASFVRLVGLRDGEIASFLGGSTPRYRLFNAGRWSVAPIGREARFRMGLERMRLQGFDRIVARGDGGALAWDANTPSKAVGSISMPLPLNALAGELAWEAAEAGPGALEMQPGDHHDLDVARTAHTRLSGAFLMGPGWERAVETWAGWGRPNVGLRIWRWEGAIALGARVGGNWAPALAMPLPAC